MSASHVHIEPPKQAIQPFGGPPSGAGSAQMYQSRKGSDREERAAWNQGCFTDV